MSCSYVNVLFLPRLQERIATLRKQSSQIALQAQQERENFQREKNNLLVMLQKARARLLAQPPVNILRRDRLTGNFPLLCRRERG